jgi:hypothetical protein
MIHRLFVSVLALLTSFSVFAADVELNPDHPQNYTVVKGDTLWDISGKFLKYPWHWPDIWQVNPQIENPHLIYPGDELVLAYCDGKPCIQLNRGKRTVKLSPQMREIIVDEAIPTIPYEVIKPFLTRPHVVGDEVLESAPYVVATQDERLITGAGDVVYAKGVDEEMGRYFSIFRGGKAYVDPDSKEILGYEAIYSGEATVDSFGEPARVTLQSTNREVMAGDRLLNIDEEAYAATFTPRRLEQELEGKIISVFDGVSQVGQYQIVVLNRGDNSGLQPGHVLTVYKAGETVKDQVLSQKYKESYFNLRSDGYEHRNATVDLPDEKAGVAMVFKTFEKVSYAIVMKAFRAIHVFDKVKSAE